MPTYRLGKYLKRGIWLALVISAVVLVLEIPQLWGETTAVTSYVANLLFKDNFHEVVANQVYRSSEMTYAELERQVSANKIRTVIDLRLGEDPLKDGRNEQTVLNGLGVKYLHVPLAGSRVPSRSEMEVIFSAFDAAQKPILIHCSSGTHRSGVVAALWLIDKENVSPEEAANQLSTKYGYFGFERRFKSWMQGYPTIDGLIWEYMEAHKRTAVSLRDWVAKSLEVGKGS